MQPTSPIRSRSEEGFLLVAMILAVALILIFLAVAAPTVAKDLQRERAIEMVHRGNQYVRAIRVYYRKNGSYPPSIDALVKSNNIRYLRQKYADPMTGKDDWRIIHVGENQTQVTGFFGEPLTGLSGPGGIGGASSPGSPVQTTGTGNGAAGVTGTPGTPGSTGPASNDATTFNGGGGPIMGVSSLSSKDSIIAIHGKTTYDTWEFLYDPRIEVLYNKSKLTGGGGGTDATTGMGATPIGSPAVPPNNPSGTPTTSPTNGPSSFGGGNP
jgi:type II secretory pathway pseudopilin PulG